MTQAKKARKKIDNPGSDGNWNIDELVGLVESLGFVSSGGAGSHEVFTRDGVQEIVNLQKAKGSNKAKGYQVRQVREIIKKYAL